MVPSTQVIEAGESAIQGYLQLHSKFEASLIYMRLCVRAFVCACVRVCVMGAKGEWRRGTEGQSFRHSIRQMRWTS